MKRKWIVGLLIGLLIFSLGCSLTNILQGVEEASEKAQEVLEVVEEIKGEDTNIDGEAEEDAEEDAEVGEFDSGALEELESYRMKIEFRFVNADGSDGVQTIEIAHTQESSAEHTVMSGMTDDDQSIDMEIIQIGSQQWMLWGEDWIYSEVQEGEEDFVSDASGIDEFDVEDLADAKYLGKETVNGITCRHYEFDEESAIFAEAGMVGDVEEAHAEVWIANEKSLPSFIVRYEIEANGKATEESPIEKFFMTMNVTDVNTDIKIEPPTGAETSGEDGGTGGDGSTGDVPVMENAQNKAVIGNIIFYEAATDFQSVVDFYAIEMESKGWTKSETIMSMENMLMESWTKGDRSVQLNIVADDDSGTVAVTIMEESGQ